jgi:hypothetical protein
VATMQPSREDESFFNLAHAKWVVGILNLTIAVVGRETLLGLLLRQTRSEVMTLVRDEEPDPAAARLSAYRNN